MCLSGQTLSENTEFTSYSHHIQAEKTLSPIQAWRDNTIGYIRAPSGTQPRTQASSRHLCYPSATETQQQLQLRLSLLLPNALTPQMQEIRTPPARSSAPTFTSRGVLISKLDEHL